MKKLLFILVLLVAFKSDAFATDACDRFLPRDENFMGKISMAANLRTFPCISKSEVLGVSRLGEVYKVTASVDGYYQIEIEGKSYWIWEKAIERSNQTVEIKAEPIYLLGKKDLAMIDKFMTQVGDFIERKGYEYVSPLIDRLEQLIDSGKYSLRTTSILKEIKRRITYLEY